LRATLARIHDVDRLSSFFDLIQQDPVVSQVKLIAEPWDIGEGGYQVGNFPPVWSEWNRKYRDTVRDLWRGSDQALAEFGSRLTGSSDLYQATGRRPCASVNFITAHDGFTLRDLVSTTRSTTRPTARRNRDGGVTTARGTVASKGYRPARRARAPQAPDAKLPHDADAVAGRAHAPRRRRDWPDAAG
jgi:glycogen operon protein